MSASAFTTEVLDWAAWIAPVDVATATPEQAAVLEESGPHAKNSQYYHLLLHDAPALRERSALFNAIMYGPRGLPRAERELGATVESILNGCVYCTSVHARFFVQLAKRPDVIERLFARGIEAELEPRERAIADFSAKLATSPPSAGPAEIRALREAGLSDSDIADLANSVAMFAWANRLMLTLGEPVKPGAATE